MESKSVRLQGLHDQCVLLASSNEDGMDVKLEEYTSGRKLTFSHDWLRTGDHQRRVSCEIINNSNADRFTVIHHPLLLHLVDDEQLMKRAHDVSHLSIKQLIDNANTLRSYSILHHCKDVLNQDWRNGENFQLVVDPISGLPTCKMSAEDNSLMEQMMMGTNVAGKSVMKWWSLLQQDYIIHRSIQVLIPINSIQVRQENVKAGHKLQENAFDHGVSVAFKQNSHLHLKLQFHGGGLNGWTNFHYRYFITDSSANHEQLFIHSQLDIEEFLDIKKTATGESRDIFDEIRAKIFAIQARLCYIPLRQHLVQNTIGRTRIGERQQGTAECEIVQLSKCMMVFCRRASFQLESAHHRQPQRWNIKLELRKLSFEEIKEEEVVLRSFGPYHTLECVGKFIRIMTNIMNLFNPVQQLSAEMMREEHAILRRLFDVAAYDFNALKLRYFAASYEVEIGCSSNGRLTLHFPEANPHRRMKDQLEALLNRYRNVLTLVYELVYTCAPLLAIRQLEKGLFGVERKDGAIEKQFKLFFLDTHNFQLYFYNQFSLGISCSGFNSVEVRDLNANSATNEALRNMAPVPGLRALVEIFRHTATSARIVQPRRLGSELILSHQEFDVLCSPCFNSQQSYLEKFLLAALNMHSLVSTLQIHQLAFIKLPLAVFQAQVEPPLLPLYEFGFALKKPGAPRCLFHLNTTSTANLKFLCFPGCAEPRLEHSFTDVDCRVLEYFINTSLLRRELFNMNAVKSITEILRSSPLLMIDLVHLMRLQLLTSQEHDPYTFYRWSLKIPLTAPITINNIPQGHPCISVTSERATVFIQLTENFNKANEEPIKFVLCLKRCDPYGAVQVFGPRHSLPHKTIDVLKFKSMRIIDDFHDNYQVPRPLLLFYAVGYLIKHLRLD